MLKQVLFPITEEEFFRDYWTRKFIHIPGAADKFSTMYPWEVLNRVLEENRADPDRLVLFKGGKRIEPGRYLNGRQVNASKLVNELSNGATLIFNQCEEVYPPLREFCIHLERLFHVTVCVNLYAGWCQDNGFDVHWDTQDVLILQVSGRKQWKVWNPTRPHPFKADAVDTSDKTRPTDAPLWDAVLEPGGMLNIPRGWWHVAYPMNEPCLHLTVTARNLNGIELLNWLAEKMKTSETARMELPVVASPLERKLWLKQVKRDLDAAWSETLIDDFLTEQDENTVPRPALSLPFAADPRNSSLRMTTPIELAIPRPLHFTFEDETASLIANGSEWQVKRGVAEKLQRFNDFQLHTLEELSPESDFRVTTLVMAMIKGGILRQKA